MTLVQVAARMWPWDFVGWISLDPVVSLHPKRAAHAVVEFKRTTRSCANIGAPPLFRSISLKMVSCSDVIATAVVRLTVFAA
jgi:hypothetical protein